MDGVELKPGYGFSRRSNLFTVTGKPDLHIPYGSDKGKEVRPQEVRVTWGWPDREPGRDEVGWWWFTHRWEASVTGLRVFPNGKLGAELVVEFTPNNGWKMERPLWLLDLVRKLGPKGWKYEGH